MKNNEKGSAPDGGLRNKSPKQKSPLGVTDRGMLITQPEHDNNSEEVTSKGAVGPSQPASTSAEVESEASKKGVVPQEDGPSQHISASRSYASVSIIYTV